MAFYLAQSGTNLYKVDPSTGVGTQLTLPTGVTLSATRKPRFAILDEQVVMVNSPSRNIAIDAEANVRVLVPRAPVEPPALAAGSSTGLTGDYMVRVSFLVLDDDGQVLAESPLSPTSVTVGLADDDLSIGPLPVSEDEIDARRIYRTAAGGSDFFRLIDIPGNTAGVTVTNNLADESLELLTLLASSFASPPATIEGVPRLKNIVAWRNRLWGATEGHGLQDVIFFTEDGSTYQWPHRLNINPVGQSATGVVGFGPMKNQLAVFRDNGTWLISLGSSTENVSITQVSEQGCVSPDSIVTIDDAVYFLSTDGVYQLKANTVTSISEDSTKPWFNTGTYFNRTRFANAFAKYNESRNQYELHLAAAGSSNEDRWVAYNLTAKTWYGPHKTDLFTPSAGMTCDDSSGLPATILGGTNGVLYIGNQTTFRDGTSTLIDMDVIGPFHHANNPDIEHFWGMLSMFSRVEASGTLTVTPTVGRFTSSAGSAISHALTSGRERLRRLGVGPMVRLRFQEATVNQGVSIYGYEIPFHEVGRR